MVGGAEWQYDIHYNIRVKDSGDKSLETKYCVKLKQLPL